MNLPDFENDDDYRGDILFEAARQLSGLPDHTDLVTVGEQMEDSEIASRDDGKTFGELDDDLYSHAQKDILKAIEGAADLSLWSVSLGALGVKPVDDVLSGGYSDDDKPEVVILFAFADSVDEKQRADLMGYISAGVAIRRRFEENEQAMKSLIQSLKS